MGVLADIPFRLCGFGYGLAYLDRIVIQCGSPLESQQKSKRNGRFLWWQLSVDRLNGTGWWSATSQIAKIGTSQSKQQEDSI